jgi:hypothetical protein
MKNRSPVWINSAVIIEALALREQGLLSPLLNKWIEQLLELDDSESFTTAPKLKR